MDDKMYSNESTISYDEFKIWFNKTSEQAANFESEGDWEAAEECWGMAIKLAKNNNNKEWSHNRYLFCKRMKENEISSGKS